MFLVRVELIALWNLFLSFDWSKISVRRVSGLVFLQGFALHVFVYVFI